MDNINIRRNRRSGEVERLRMWTDTEFVSMLILTTVPGGSKGKESACNVGYPGSIPMLGRSPGRWHANPLQYSCLEYPHGQRSLVGYSSWGCKESDMTERLTQQQQQQQPLQVVFILIEEFKESSIWIFLN